MPAQQPELFPLGSVDAVELPAGPVLTSTSTLREAMAPFEEYMVQREFALNTIKAFGNDLNLLLEYAGDEAALSHLSPQKLEAFVAYLEHERGVPCSPKSLHRRVTTLKVFFRWLTQKGVLAVDPADGLQHERVNAKLPQVLAAAELVRLLETTRSMQDADEAPDARPHLLVTLVLETAMKKSECMGIALEHIDLSNPEHPSVYIHYERPRQRHKSRRLALSPEWPTALELYLRRYQPEAMLFECTARNLEYVLHNTSLVAGLPHRLSFEMLRWTSALASLKEGMELERLRRRMGLSEVTWRETLPILQVLADGPL